MHTMKRFGRYMLGLLAIGMVAMSAPARQIMIGPANPGAEDGSDGWWVGASGKGYLLVDHTDPASGNSDFALGNTNLDGDNSAGWRSVIFPLGPAAAGSRPITFSFRYKLADDVKPGDNLLVQLRFYDRSTNWLNEKNFYIGSGSHDSAMDGYKTVIVSNLRASRRAQVADINISANVYGNHWSSGTGRFDDFSVTTTTHPLLLGIGISAMALLGIAATVLLLRHFRGKQRL